MRLRLKERFNFRFFVLVISKNEQNDNIKKGTNTSIRRFTIFFKHLHQDLITSVNWKNYRKSFENSIYEHAGQIISCFIFNDTFSLIIPTKFMNNIFFMQLLLTNLAQNVQHNFIYIQTDIIIFFIHALLHNTRTHQLQLIKLCIDLKLGSYVNLCISVLMWVTCIFYRSLTEKQTTADEQLSRSLVRGNVF